MKDSIVFRDLNVTATQIASSLRFANVLIAQGLYLRAESLLLRLVMIDPDNAYVRTLLGSLNQKQNKPEKAIANYSRAIAIFPEDINSLANRGELYLQMGQLEKAAADFTKAIQMDPDCKHPSGNRARLLVAMALSALDRGKTIKPEDPPGAE
jgi:tetratricopeptide (TPR) repeat protein